MTTTTQTATGTFAIQSWDEDAWAPVEGGPKLTHARIVTAYRGDLEGEGTSQSLMRYEDDSKAEYSGLERVAGRLAGRSGSFVMEGRGTYENGTATTTWTVIPGSGTGDLAGLRGSGGFAAGHGQNEVEYRLEYRFD
jgi:Protein of unknown function (DUF3224)